MFSHKFNFSEETLRKAEGTEIINYALMNSLLRGRTETTTKRTFEINAILNVETINTEIKVKTNTIQNVQTINTEMKVETNKKSGVKRKNKS